MYLKSPLKGAQRAFLSLALMMFLSITLYAQTSNDWILHNVNSGVEVYYKISKCMPNPASITDPAQFKTAVQLAPTVLLLKFVNTTNETKDISWNAALNSSTQTLVHQLLLANGATNEISCGESPTIDFNKNSITPQPQSMIEALTFLNLSITTN